MAMVADASPSLEDSGLIFRYDMMGFEAINGMIEATEKCIQQVPGLPAEVDIFVQQEIFDKMGMTSSTRSRSPYSSEISVEIDSAWTQGTGISIGWKSVLSDMGKLGSEIPG